MFGWLFHPQFIHDLHFCLSIKVIERVKLMGPTWGPPGSCRPQWAHVGPINCLGIFQILQRNTVGLHFQNCTWQMNLNILAGSFQQKHEYFHKNMICSKCDKYCMLWALQQPWCGLSVALLNIFSDLRTSYYTKNYVYDNCCKMKKLIDM